MKYQVKVRETSNNKFKVSLIRCFMHIPIGHEVKIGYVSSDSTNFDDRLHTLISEAKDKAITVNSVDTRVLV